MASEFVQLSGTLTLANGTEVASGLFSQTQGEGAAGSLTIETGRLIVQGGAQVTASTRSEGQGGTLAVTALESVEVSGTSTAANQPTPSGIFAIAEGASGDAGNLSIETRRLIEQDGAVVTASTFGGSQGRGGTLAVTASDSVALSGTTPNGEFSSGLLVGTEGGAAAGALSVETGQLIVRDGAVVSAATSGQGIGGDISVQADTVSLTNGARITSRSEGQANAGSIELQAGSLSLDEGAFISAETAGGEGGNIRLQVEDTLLLHRTIRISTEAGGTGNGGNMDIDSDFIVAVPAENSDIIANAFEGRGGNINITAQGIFGIEFRDRQTSLSDITASSEFGLNGVVEINTSDVDPSQGLAELPTNLVDAQGLLDRSCSVSSKTRGDSFTVTGRGGLPSNPGEPLTSDALAVDWVSLNSDVENHAPPRTTTPNSSARRPIVEAQGWVVNEKGQVVLVAQAPTVTPQGQWLDSAQCNTPQTSSTP